MRRLIVRLLVAVATVTSVLAMASIAKAAPPSNDNFANRLTAGLQDVSFNLAEASIEPFESQVFPQCGSPNAQHSVWYQLDVSSVPVGGIVDVDIASDSFGKLEYQVVTGQPGNFTRVDCGTTGFSTRSAFVPQPGQTYYLVAYVWDGSQGGPATIHIGVNTDLAINVTGAVLNRDGTVTVTGTYICTTPDLEFVDISNQVTQRVGNAAVLASTNVFLSGPELVCDGSTQPWSAPGASTSGRFAGGSVTITGFFTFFYADGGPRFFNVTLPSVTAQLRGGGNTNPGQPPAPDPSAIDLTGNPRNSVVVIDIADFKLTLNSRGSTDRSGNVTISGTYTCAAGEEWGFGLITNTIHRTGRAYATTFGVLDRFFPPATCDDHVQQWTLTLAPTVNDTHTTGGKATVSMEAIAFNFVTGEVSDTFPSYIIQINPS